MTQEFPLILKRNTSFSFHRASRLRSLVPTVNVYSNAVVRRVSFSYQPRKTYVMLVSAFIVTSE